MLESTLRKIESEDFLRVLCIGDIQTSQPKTVPKWSDWLQYFLRESGDKTKTWRRSVLNAGVDKATPRNVATYFDYYVKKNNPDLVILSFGLASILSTYSEVEFANELGELLAKLIESDTEIAIWSPFPVLGGKYMKELQSISNIYSKFSETLGVRYVDLYHEIGEYSLSQLYTHRVAKSDVFWKLETGSFDYANSNSVMSYIVGKSLTEQILGVSTVIAGDGDMEVPNLAILKNW